MPSSKSIANHIKTINKELNEIQKQKRNKLKEDIKHRKKGGGLEKN